MSELAADQLGFHLGSTLQLTLGDGTPATFTVAAVYARGLGFGDLPLPHDLLAHHMDNPLASAVLIPTDKEAKSAGTPGKSITHSEPLGLVKEFPGVSLVTPSSVDKVRADARRSNAEVNYPAMGLVLAFTAIVVVNTLAMSVSERFREFTMLRLMGATRRQVLRMLRIEALSVLLIASVLGSGISLAVLTAFSIGMTGSATPAVLPLVYAAVVLRRRAARPSRHSAARPDRAQGQPGGGRHRQAIAAGPGCRSLGPGRDRQPFGVPGLRTTMTSSAGPAP